MQERPVVFFHIGGHKTGTTYLQSVLWRNRAELRRNGLLYPGSHKAAHVWASLDLRGTGFRGYRAAQVTRAWPRLVGEIRQWGGSAIIDHELFSLTDRPQIARALHDLAFADVHVVFTARDMARQLPAAWQEWLKNRSTISYADFLTGVRSAGSAEARRFMGMHDVPAILSRWAAQTSPERVHVITVPPSGSDPMLLWQRFAAVLGIDPEGYDLETRHANTSLGAAEASVLRRLNEQLGRTLSWPDYNRLVKFGLAPALAGRSGVRIAVPETAYSWALRWAEQAVTELAAAGYPVTGELAELVPTRRPTGADPDNVDAEDQAAAAVAALGVLVSKAASARRRHGVAPSVAAKRRSPDLVKHAARRLADKVAYRVRERKAAQ